MKYPVRSGSDTIPQAEEKDLILEEKPFEIIKNYRSAMIQKYRRKVKK